MRCWTLVILCLDGLIVRWSVLHRSLCCFKRLVLHSLCIVNVTRKLLYIPQSFLMRSSIRPTCHERIIQCTEPKSRFLAVRWKMRPWSLLCDSTFTVSLSRRHCRGTSINAKMINEWDVELCSLSYFSCCLGIVGTSCLPNSVILACCIDDRDAQCRLQQVGWRWHHCARHQSVWWWCAHWENHHTTQQWRWGDASVHVDVLVKAKAVWGQSGWDAESLLCVGLQLQG